MVLDLVPLWTILLGLAVFYYVVFDGFDLGVGILYGLLAEAFVEFAPAGLRLLERAV